MKARRLLIVAACVMVVGQVARADSALDDQAGAAPPPPEAFHANQVQLDLFGTWTDRDRYGLSHNQGGGGVGVDYFFLRYLGIGVDSYLDEWRAPYRVNGSAIARLPLQHGDVGLAPYVFGGGGREFRFAPQYTYHAGAGLEFKFNRYLGVFGDYRRVFPDRTPDYSMARLGMSLSF